MILYLLRHGLAADRANWNKSDDLRPLTDKGERNLHSAANALFRLELGLAKILSSPLVRAIQTAEIVAKHLKLENELIQDERLAPGFNFQDLAEILSEHTQAEAIMLVGHEPDLSDLASGLIGGGNIMFKKGGLARIDLWQIDPPAGELVWLIPPKVLVRLGS